PDPRTPPARPRPAARASARGPKAPAFRRARPKAAAAAPPGPRARGRLPRRRAPRPARARRPFRVHALFSIAQTSSINDGAHNTHDEFRGSGAVSLLKTAAALRLNSSHVKISYAVFCLKKKK